MRSARDIYVVDVCGTLVDDDTTLGLLRYHFTRTQPRSWRAALLRALSNRRNPVWFGLAIAEKLVSRQFVKHLAVRLLSGNTPASLEASAVEYADWLLRERRVQQVWDLLVGPLDRGEVVLASSSLRPVVAALADSIGAGHVASDLELREGKYTGRYARDITGQKDFALARQFGDAFISRIACVITDNLSDLPLIKNSPDSWIVVRTTSQRDRWHEVDAEFLTVT